MLDEQKLLRWAYQIAATSSDPSTQNGAFLCWPNGNMVQATAQPNRFPLGVSEWTERWVRPEKYAWVEHAERNAIYAAAKHGISTWGMTMVCAWAACPDCARAIIEAGIERLITHKQAQLADAQTHWSPKINTAFVMLEEAGVEVVFYDGCIGGPDILRNGQRWRP
jgi:dCMP deaminase